MRYGIVEPGGADTPRSTHTVTLTPFGWFYLALLAAVCVFRRTWLPALLPVAAVLHAPAVLVLCTDSGQRGFGVTPWQVTCLALAVFLIAAVPSLRERLESTSRTVLQLLMGWTLFIALCVASAFVMPLLFEGLPTYNNELVENLAVGPQPLTLRLGNIAQAANAVLVWLALTYALVAQSPRSGTRVLLNGVLLAAVLSLSASLVQRGLLLMGIDAIDWARPSLNPGYDHVVGFLFARDGIRVGWPFSEPSYASVWFAALTVAGSASYLWQGGRYGLVLLGCGAGGLLSSFSGTGVAAALLAGSAVWLHVLVHSVWYERRGPEWHRAIRLAVGVLLGAGGAVLLATQVELSHPNVGTRTAWQAVLEFMTHKIMDHRSDDPGRSLSNLHALQILVETGGVGVGLGSNRASSYFANLLSNLGLLPSLLLIGLLALQLRILWRGRADPLAKVALTTATLTILIGITLGIPDLLWPVWWLVLIATFWIVCWSEVDRSVQLQKAATGAVSGRA